MISSETLIKVVINALPYKTNSSGIGVLIRELFGAYASLTERHCQVILPCDAPAFACGCHTELIRRPFTHSQGLRRIFFQSLRLGREYCRESILLTTDSKMPFFLPHSCRVVTLVTDLAVFRFPKVYQPSRVLLWRMQYCYLRRRADCFLTISEFTKRELTELLKIPPEKIAVIPCAAPAQMERSDTPQTQNALRQKYGLPERFILFVGNANPRKNLERMLSAFDIAKEHANLPHHLVIAGEQGWKFSREAALRGISHRAEVHFIGFVPDADMAALYSAAELFVFPTLYEGFGIPVIEAQSCGTPVLTSDCSALPETGGAGAIYIDPYQTEAISDGILQILQNSELRSHLIEAGYQNAQRFSWERSARRLQQIIEEEENPMLKVSEQRAGP